MSVRLYPKTKDPVKLEKLAGVPIGTYAKLEALEAMEPNWNKPKSLADEEAWFDLLDESEYMQALHMLKTFGFGRVRADLEGFGLDPICGSTDEAEMVKTLLIEQDLNLTSDILTIAYLCEGVCWS